MSNAQTDTPTAVMKRLLLILSLVAFAACSSETLDSADKRQEDSAIRFGNLDTRAAVSAASDITEFAVFAEMNMGEESSEYVKLLENEMVYKENGEWTYANKRYWIDGRTFHFMAVYPYFDPSRVQPVTLKQSGVEYSGYQINFDTPTTADQDLLVDMATVYILGEGEKAKNENDEELETSYPTVNFDFAHILSKINLKVAKNGTNADETIKVTRIVLDGVKQSGAYSCSRSSEYTANWVVNDSPKMTISRDMEIVISKDGTEVLGDGILLIPQTILGSNSDDSARVRLTIRYEYYPQGSNISTIYEASTLLPGETWLANTAYGYSVELDAIDNDILFTTPTIKPWGDPQSVGGTIIIH